MRARLPAHACARANSRASARSLARTGTQRHSGPLPGANSPARASGSTWQSSLPRGCSPPSPPWNGSLSLSSRLLNLFLSFYLSLSHSLSLSIPISILLCLFLNLLFSLNLNLNLNLSQFQFQFQSLSRLISHSLPLRSISFFPFSLARSLALYLPSLRVVPFESPSPGSNPLSLARPFPDSSLPPFPVSLSLHLNLNLNLNLNFNLAPALARSLVCP